MGVIAHGVVGIGSQRMWIELAFHHAWRDWPQRSRFPVIHAGMDRNDIVRILDASENRRWGGPAYWDTQLPAAHYTPRLRDSWDLDEALEAHEQRTGIARQAWLDLAVTFLDDLGDERVVRN